MKIKRLLWSVLQPALAFKICFVSYEIFIVNYKKNNFYQINLFRYIINSFQIITSQFKNDLYRYLTFINLKHHSWQKIFESIPKNVQTFLVKDGVVVFVGKYWGTRKVRKIVF